MNHGAGSITQPVTEIGENVSIYVYLAKLLVHPGYTYTYCIRFTFAGVAALVTQLLTQHYVVAERGLDDAGYWGYCMSIATSSVPFY